MAACEQKSASEGGERASPPRGARRGEATEQAQQLRSPLLYNLRGAGRGGAWASSTPVHSAAPVGFQRKDWPHTSVTWTGGFMAPRVNGSKGG